MKKTYITPKFIMAELELEKLVALSTDENWAHSGEGGEGWQGGSSGGEDGDGSDGLAKGDRNLWDEEW